MNELPAYIIGSLFKTTVANLLPNSLLPVTYSLAEEIIV